MAKGIVDTLEPVEIDQGDRAGRAVAPGAVDLLAQHAHDASAVERTGQFVELGEFFDALIGFLQLEAALVERLFQRA